MASPDATLAAAEILAATGRTEDARQAYRRVLDYAPGNVPAILGLARLALDAGRLAEAVALARSGVAENPGDVRLAVLQGDVGRALFRQGFWEDASPLLASAAALEPWDRGLAAAAQRAMRPAYLAPTVIDPGGGRPLERYAAREGATYIFVIDIVGTCNLRCPTCPVGNSPARAKGFMHREMFERIVAKIRQESPVPEPQINLYNWGEPLLHPELPDMIARLRALGMRSALSSNLNIRRGLDAMIAANPDELKISLSGFSQATYARAHARGNLDLVKANMAQVRTSLDTHRAGTRVWVGHHIYRSNRHEMAPVQRLCAELGFEYHPIPAFYMPLERVIDSLDGTANPRDGGILDDLLVTPAERARALAARRSGRFDCELRFNQTVINHDGTVALCCTVYDAANMLGVSYLDEAFDRIEQRKYAHPFCRTCTARNLAYVPAELDPSPGTGSPAALRLPTIA